MLVSLVMAAHVHAISLITRQNYKDKGQNPKRHACNMMTTLPYFNLLLILYMV